MDKLDGLETLAKVVLEDADDLLVLETLFAELLFQAAPHRVEPALKVCAERGHDLFVVFGHKGLAERGGLLFQLHPRCLFRGADGAVGLDLHLLDLLVVLGLELGQHLFAHGVQLHLELRPSAGGHLFLGREVGPERAHLGLQRQLDVAGFLFRRVQL